MGVVCATVYLMCMFFFIPFPFMEWFTGKGIISRSEEFHAPTFPHHKVCILISFTVMSVINIYFDLAGRIFGSNAISSIDDFPWVRR